MIQEIDATTITTTTTTTTTTTSSSSSSKNSPSKKPILIEIVHEESLSSSSSSVSSLVDTALTSFIDHLKKPLHFQYLVEKYQLGVFQVDGDDENESSRRLLSPQLPTSVQNLKVNLFSSLFGDINGDDDNTKQKYAQLSKAQALLLRSYITRIRPTLFQKRTNQQQLHLINYDGIPILQQYELFLTEFHTSLNKMKRVGEEQPSTSQFDDDGDDGDGDTIGDDDTITMPLIIDTLIHDITMITATKYDLENNKDKTKQEIVCNIVLPTLLQILGHAVDSFIVARRGQTITTNESGKEIVVVSEEKPQLLNEEAFYDILATVAIVALAFRSPLSPKNSKASSLIDPRLLDSTLADVLDGSNTMVNKFCVYPPVRTTTTPERKNDPLVLNHGESVVNWEHLSLDGSMWNDSTTGTATKMADKLWNMLYATLLVQNQTAIPQCSHSVNRHICQEQRDDDVHDNNNDKIAVARKVCRLLGYERITRAVRAHFFARDTSFTNYIVNKEREESSNHSSTLMIQQATTNIRLFGKSPTKNEKEPLDEQPFENCPSRIYVVANLMSLLNFAKVIPSSDSGATDTAALSSTTAVPCGFLSDMLPICFSLIDSTYPKHIAIGAAILSRLLLEFKHNLSSLEDFEENIISVLELTCRSCRNGGALALICVARSRFFRNFLDETGAGERRKKERRQATGQLLSILERNSYKEMDTEDGLILGLLVGGIVPLLHQHAIIQDTNDTNTIMADSLEMGRIGLAALLPLLRWDYAWEGRRIQFATLTALVNLLVGAYPMMTRHGGKIICELLSCIGHADPSCEKHCTIVKHPIDFSSDNSRMIENDVLSMALHASAVALIVCGDRASSILNQLQQDENHERYLLLHCQNIQERASYLLTTSLK